jgi:hypothetical protein
MLRVTAQAAYLEFVVDGSRTSHQGAQPRVFAVKATPRNDGITTDEYQSRARLALLGFSSKRRH